MDQSRPTAIPRAAVRLQSQTLIDSGTPGYFTRSELIELSGMTEHEYKKVVHRHVLTARFRSRQHHFVLYTEEDIDLCKRLLAKHFTRPVTRRVPGRRWEPTEMIRSVSGNYTKEDARTVMRMMRQGKPRDEIFLATDLHPDAITRIGRHYDQMSGGFYVSAAMLRAINELPLEGVELPITSVSELVAAFEALAAPKKCAECSEREPSLRCKVCIRKSVLEELAKRTMDRAKAVEAMVEPPAPKAVKAPRPPPPALQNSGGGVVTESTAPGRV